MASLYRRKSSGVYYAQFYDPERGRRRVSLRTKDEATARALLVKFDRLVLLGEVDPWTGDLHAAVQGERPEEISLADAFEAFLQSRREMNVTENTLRTYRETVGRLIREVGEEKPLRSLTVEVIRGYVHAGGIAPATRKKRYRVLRTFLGFHSLVEELLEEIQKPRPERKLPVACTERELEAISRAAARHYRECRRKGTMNPGDTIWRVSAFWASYLTGLRRAELARLKWRDLDLAARTLTLRKQKRRREERMPISRRAARYFEAVRRGKGRKTVKPVCYVFCAPTARLLEERNEEAFANHLTRFFRRYRRRAIAEGKNVREEVTLHSLRAGFITQLARSGLNAVAIKRLARHSDIKTSLRYIEATGEAFRSGLDEAFK